MKKVFLLLCVLFISKGHAQNIIDSLTNELQREHTDSERVIILSDLCWEYRRIDQQKALDYGKEAVRLADEYGDKVGLSKSLNDLSIIYMDKAQFDSAIHLLNRAIEIRKELKDTVGQAAVYNKLGIIYQNQMLLREALENALLALKLYEQLGMKPHARVIMNNVGIIHFNLHNYEKALEIHTALLKLRTEAGDEYGLGQTMVNIGNVYNAIGDSIQGMQSYEDAAHIFRKLQKKEELAVVLNNLGTYYNAKGQSDIAHRVLTESLSIRRTLNNPKEICSTLVMLGDHYRATRQFTTAKEHLLEALSISRQFGLPQERACCQKLAVLYRDLKNADSVFHYYQLYEAMNTALYESNLKNEVAELQTKYDTEKKEQQILFLSRENTIQQLSMSRQRIYFVGGAIILLLLGASTWLFQRTKRLKERVRHEEKLKEQQDKSARAIIETEVNERRRLGAELHDGVIQTFAAAKLNLSCLQDSVIFADPEQNRIYNNTLTLIDEGCLELRTISHTMMPEALLKKGLSVALHDLVSRIDKSILNIQLNIYGLEDRLDSGVEISVYRIVQECLNNTLKHAGATRLDIQINVEAEQLELVIEDNGKGFDSKLMNESSGIGLQNIRSRVDLLSGQIEVHSKPGKGVMFSIALPLQVRFQVSPAI